MDFDKQQGHAVPTKYIYESSGEVYQKISHNYNYQPLEGGEASFDVADYCN